MYNFGPKHRKLSLFDILPNPVPGIKFDGRIGESDDFDSLQRRRFNHNLIARRITRNKQLLAKRTTCSSMAIIHDFPMAHTCKTAPILSGYQTYATFHDTSMEDAVVDSHLSMPMTLYFAVCEFSCPEIVFASLPRQPPDGIFTTFIVSAFIGFIFGTMTVWACMKISAYSLWKSFVATIQAAIRHKDRPIESTTTHDHTTNIDVSYFFGMMVSAASLHRWHLFVETSQALCQL